MLCTREVTVQVPDGLHHQTAARFIQTANRFTSVVRVVYGDNNAVFYTHLTLPTTNFV